MTGVGLRLPLRISAAGDPVATGEIHLPLSWQHWQKRGFPLVSCIMPTRGRPEFARRAIQLFEAQTYPNRELILVRGGKAGESFETLFRRGISQAKGGYLCRWDDDDLSHPHRLEVQVAALEAAGAEACVLLRHLMQNDSGPLLVSKLRAWPSSLLWRRAEVANLGVSLEDGGVAWVTRLMRQHRIALMETPYLYTTVFHGRNRFLTAERFERLLDGAPETILEDDPPGSAASIGLVITTYNRPEYLSRCLQSLAASRLENTAIAIVDDASSDEQTKKLVRVARFPGVRVTRIFKRFRRGFDVHGSLRLGWDHLLEHHGCRYLCNLDSDGLVHPEWLDRITRLFERERARTGPLVVTGFNAHSHAIATDGADFREKRSIGGINLFFDRTLYAEVIRPNLVRDLSNWDWDVVAALQKCGGTFLCTRPSVVQHIGEWGTWSTELAFDRAEDYVALGTPSCDSG